jgi:hypothetical protein
MTPLHLKKDPEMLYPIAFQDSALKMRNHVNNSFSNVIFDALLSKGLK